MDRKAVKENPLATFSWVVKSLLIVLALFGSSAFAQTEAILQLDTGGHKDAITDVLVTRDKRYLVSASNDKTIRVWDTHSKKEVRKILGQIGSGWGAIYTIALTPDDQTLAVGGFLGKTGVGGTGRIRLYDFPSGKLRQILKSHTNVVVDLHFSEDGRYLVSGSFDSTVKVWKKEDAGFVLHKTFSEHTDDVFSVRIFSRGQKFRVVSASIDHTVKLYSLEVGLLKTYDQIRRAQYLAVSDRFIAASGTPREIQIFDHNLKLLHSITHETRPAGLSFSPDGRSLLAGSSDPPHNTNVYDTRTWKKRTSFTKHDNQAQAVTFLDNQTAITAGGNNNEIYFWDIKKIYFWDILSSQVQGKIAGVGKSVWSVGLKDNEIAFGNTRTAGMGASEFEKSFNFKQLSISKNPQGFQRISQRYGDYALTHSSGGEFIYRDAVLEIQRNATTTAEVTLGRADGYQHRVSGFTEKGIILSGAGIGHLAAYSLKGERIADFIGHAGDVWSIAVQGDRLVSGSDDQTIKIWSLKDLHSASEIYPLATLFVGSNDEWVLWTKSGYYNASLGGDKYVGFHINHGPDKEAEFYSSDRFYKQLYRPDIVQATLELGDEEKAIAFVSRSTKTVVRTTEEILPPKVEIVSPSDGFSTNQHSVRLLANITSASQQQVEELVIKLNGRKLPGKRGIKVVSKENYDLDQIIELDPGENILELVAKSAFASSNPARVSVVYQPPQAVEAFKPDLYLLAIGISQYKNALVKTSSGMWLENLTYADKDAEAVQKIYKAQEGRLFDNVHVTLLTNGEATKGNVLDAFDWIDREVTQHDVAVVFIAGHGVNDARENYYFLPHDTDLEKLRRTAVDWNGFNLLLADLPSKRTVLLVDTCNSGNVTGSTKTRGLESNITRALKDLADTEAGVVVMSASTGKELSWENEAWGHGAFTKALVEGMESFQADVNNDQVITFKELDLFVTQYVKQLTGGKQHATTQVPENIRDFPLIAR